MSTRPTQLRSPTEQALLDTLAGLTLVDQLQQTVRAKVSRTETTLVPENVMAPLLVLKHLARPARPAEVARVLQFPTGRVTMALVRWFDSDGFHFINRSEDGRYSLTLKGHRLAAELVFEGFRWLAAHRA